MWVTILGAKGSGSVRWGIERRLEFIEFRLFWEGHVNRSDLMAAFGISINQASADLNRYLGMAPGNMVYDKRGDTGDSKIVAGKVGRRRPA